MLVQLTVIPVALVKASTVALGGGLMASATLMVTPVVAEDAAPSPLEQAAPSRATHPSAATAVVRLAPCRMESMGDASLSRTARHTGSPLRALRAVFAQSGCAFSDRT